VGTAACASRRHKKIGGQLAYAITSEDFLAICLILARGDTDLSTEEIIGRAEAYQEKVAGQFGVSNSDFRMAFWWLGIEVGLLKWDSMTESGQVLAFQEIPLRQWIPPILQYADVYFNDEGEYWSGIPYDPPSYRYRLMYQFFNNRANNSPEEVLRFLAKFNWGNDLLERFGRPPD
jgi:hypothetical protein